MRKLVVLKLDGDLEVGVRVALEIGFEGKLSDPHEFHAARKTSLAFVGFG
jgi:hypothetical protein